MRQLKFTHSEIELIQLALSIAEKQFSDLHKTIIESVVNVRTNNNHGEHSTFAKYYGAKANELGSMNELISNGKFDI